MVLLLEDLPCPNETGDAILISSYHGLDSRVTTANSRLEIFVGGVNTIVLCQKLSKRYKRYVTCSGSLIV